MKRCFNVLALQIRRLQLNCEHNNTIDESYSYDYDTARTTVRTQLDIPTNLYQMLVRPNTIDDDDDGGNYNNNNASQWR